MKKVLSIALIGLIVLSTLSILGIRPVSAATNDYVVFSQFDPGVGPIWACGGYVEYYGVPEWGDEIQYVYFIKDTTGYKYKVWVTNEGGPSDPTPYIDIRQHPSSPYPSHVGPVEPRHFEYVSSKNLAPYSANLDVEEFYVDSTGVYLGPNVGIHKWDHDWNYIGQVGPAFGGGFSCQSLAYNAKDNIWYTATYDRRLYQLSDTDGDGNLMDESWQYVFTYPNYGGSHHDGMEYVGGYLWISDMTVAVIGKWQYNSGTHTWTEVGRYTYPYVNYVEGMGFGPNDHFWITSGFPGGGGHVFYEVGDEITMYYPIADAGEDVQAYPPTIPVSFDGSGSHHTDPSRKIVLYEWDFDGDGVYDYSSTEPAAEHTYPAYYNPDGSIDWGATAKTYTVYLKVTDDDPVTPKTDVDTCNVHITAPPWKPVADPDGPYEGNIGTPVQLDGSKSYDPESKMFPPGHPWYETIAKYEWDFDYDGLRFDVDFLDVKPTCTWTWHSEGKYIVALRVTDSQPSGPSGTIGPLDVDITYTTVTIKKTEAWSFAVITDLHIGFGYPDYGPEGFDERMVNSKRMEDSEILRLCEDYYLTDRLTKVVESINNNPQIKFVVVLGDISDTAEYSEFLKAREILNMLTVPYIPVLGNHDVWPYTQDSTQESQLFAGLVWEKLAGIPIPPTHFNPDIREKEQTAGSAIGDIYFNEIFWEQNDENLGKIREFFGDSWRRQYTSLHILRDTGLAQILQNYNFTYNGVKLIVLDCNQRVSGKEPWEMFEPDAQLFSETKEWLYENLKQAREEGKSVIIFSHHPIIQGPLCFSSSDADEIQRIIEESNAKVLACFGGHTHGNHILSPEYEFSPGKDVEFEIPSIGKKIVLPGIEVFNNKLNTDVVITEAVSRESIRWAKWFAELLPELPLRTDTKNCIRTVTILGKEVASYSRLDSVTEDPNLRPTSYFTYWPATEKMSFKKFSAFPYDPDGNPADCTYAWIFGDGQTASSDRTPWHHYKAGEYTVTLTVTDGGGVNSRPFSRTVIVRKLVEIRLWSPADLIVTDPEGLTLSKDIGEVLGMSYMEFDIYDDGKLEDIVTIWEPKIGDYLITVIPEPDAIPTDTYTLEVWIDGVTTVLAENAQMSNIPTQPYMFELTESGNLYVWQYIFKDSYGRGTTLKINTAYKFFKFIAPGKDYGIRKATYMRLCGSAIIINHCDNQLRLITTAVDTKLDFCVANVWDVKTGKRYSLLDKPGIEK
jgi:PKD repeat protein/predicted phosphohydrolase